MIRNIWAWSKIWNFCTLSHCVMLFLLCWLWNSLHISVTCFPNIFLSFIWRKKLQPTYAFWDIDILNVHQHKNAFDLLFCQVCRSVKRSSRKLATTFPRCWRLPASNTWKSIIALPIALLTVFRHTQFRGRCRSKCQSQRCINLLIVRGVTL